jgi:ABC-type multidrug transport system fused ATPase/permease subunit
LLPSCFFDALQLSLLVLGAFVLVTIALPVILPVFVPLLILFYYVRTRYIVASREVKRWEAVSRSPVYAFFAQVGDPPHKRTQEAAFCRPVPPRVTRAHAYAADMRAATARTNHQTCSNHHTLRACTPQSIKGLPTIRAYGAGPRFHAQFLDLLSLNGAWCYAVVSTARWVGFRLDSIAAMTLAAAAILAVVARGMVSPQLLGLALTHVMSIMGVMQWFVRQTAEVENHMTSVQRLMEYTELPQEPPLVGEPGGEAPRAGWPSNGELTFERVSATYRPGLPPVLRGVTFHLPAGCSCGLVGRTGSGKSTHARTHACT